MQIVECVPNFSEGRRQDVINAITNAARDIGGITILDCESDPNHNRMVLTFVGSPEAVKTAALAASAKAIALIDLTKHVGEHPRMGAVDVVPFVPLREVTMEDCIVLAMGFAKEYAEKFGVPVFLYESAASRPDRRNLADVRQGQFEGLRERMGVDPTRKPDFGPDHVHATAGATAVGARPVLIAYNVNLDTSDLSLAKKIAHKIRERDGGLPAVKALGFELKDRGLVQVSMNLTDYTKSSMDDVFDAISKLAKEDAVKVVESEIVGLVPQEALTKASVHYLSLRNFSSSQIIENRIFSSEVIPSGDSKLVFTSLTEFSERVSSKNPTPGGGSVAAYAGVLAASLVAMVCQLTIDRKKYESTWARSREILSESLELKTHLLELVDQDASAYDQVSSAYKLPKNTEDERSAQAFEMNAALKTAASIPRNTVLYSYKTFLLAKEIAEIGNRNAVSDAQTATQLSKAAILGAYDNVKVNLQSLPLKDAQFTGEMLAELDPIIQEVSG